MKELIKRLKNCGFNVEKEDGLYFISQYTPAGEDWGFYVKDEEDFYNYVENFDPEEEFEMLYKSGISGLPKVSVLIEDQYWKSEILNEVL